MFKDKRTTWRAVVEAVTRLSTLSESKILRLVSAGGDLFPVQPVDGLKVLKDTVEEGELNEASSLPLSPEQRATLIQSSVPAPSEGTEPTPPIERT